MNKQILWVNDQGYVACVDHLWLGAKEMFLANKKLRLVYSSSTSWQRLTKAEVAEYNMVCEGCLNDEAKAKKETPAPKDPAPAPAPKSSVHANCSHEKTPSARAKCRRESAKNS